MVALKIIAVGFARLVPIMSDATCLQPGSKSAYSYITVSDTSGVLE